MKNILVPTDFSDLSAQVARLAARVVEPLGGMVHLLHVLPLPVAFDESALPLTQASFSAAEDEMTTFIEQLGISHRPAVQIEMEPLHAAVEAYVDDTPIDIVMMPSHGATGLRRWFVGSHAEKVVRMSPVPVMVIKQPLAYYPPRHIAFASTFEPGERLQVNPLYDLQRMSGAKMHLVWVLKDQDEQANEEEMLMRMSEFAFANQFFQADYHIIYADDVVEGLQKFSSSYYVDLLILGTHRRSTLSQFFHHSIAEEVVAKIPQNVMTFHIQTEEVFL